jgi:hypothetical protein
MLTQLLRERSFYDGIDQNIRLTYFGTDVLVANGNQRWNTYKHMFDKVNRLPPSGFYPPSPCLSFSTTASPNMGWSGYNVYKPGTSDEQLQPFTWHEGLFEATPSDLQAFIAETATVPNSAIFSETIAAFNKFHDQVPSDVSLLNFLVELKDFKEVFEFFKKKSVRAEVFNKIKHLKPRDVPRLINSGYLQGEFGVLPFLGDLVKFTQIGDRVSRRLKYLLETKGKPVQVKFYKAGFHNSSDHVPREFTNEVYAGLPSYTPSRVGYQLQLESAQHDFAAHAVLLQNLNGLDNAWSGFRATLSALGFLNPAEVVWNALPFSLFWIGSRLSAISYIDLALSPSMGNGTFIMYLTV